MFSLFESAALCGFILSPGAGPWLAQRDEALNLETAVDRFEWLASNCFLYGY